MIFAPELLFDCNLQSPNRCVEFSFCENPQHHNNSSRCSCHCKQNQRYSIDLIWSKSNPFTMVQGMAFLSKKGFNPQNNANRKQVWEAQQNSKLESERLRKRQEQLQREKEDAELELATRGEIGGSQAQLRFMYDAPPGLEKKSGDDPAEGTANSHRGRASNTTTADDLSRVKPGDDAAAVAFRQMLAAAAASSGDNNMASQSSSGNEDPGDANKSSFKFTPSLQGSMVEADSRYNNKDDSNNDGGSSKPPPMQDSRSALEKEVGRKNRSTQNNLSYEQQIERFPQLKNAPMAVKRGRGGDTDGNTSKMMVHFKPLGSQILHVRCMACGIWGHAKGDRECQKSGWNPFAMPSQSQASSSILPPPRDQGKQQSSKHRESFSDDRNKRRKRRKERRDSDSEDSRRRKHSKSRHRRRRDYDSDDYSSDDSFSSHESRDRRKHRRRRRYKENYSHSSDDDSSNSDPSSENSSKLKRRNDVRYDSSEEERRKHRKKSRKSSKKRSKRYESSSYKKKKKRRRHDSP